MKIAVTYENGEVFQHFGHTEYFKIYDVDMKEKKINSAEVISTNNNGHGALAGFLKENQVATLICGGIGAGAQNALKEANINFYGGVTGSTDKVVTDLLANKLAYNPDVKCDHHAGHEHEHNCK